jgi:hypothetical protein
MKQIQNNIQKFAIITYYNYIQLFSNFFILLLYCIVCVIFVLLLILINKKYNTIKPLNFIRIVNNQMVKSVDTKCCDYNSL